MTTAHRPTFDPAVGKEAQRGPAYHQRLLPAHTQLKVRYYASIHDRRYTTKPNTKRKPGQGGAADSSQARDLRAELLQAEAAHFAKLNGGLAQTASGSEGSTSSVPGKRQLEDGDGQGDRNGEDLETKRRRVLEETRGIDADSDGGSEEEGSSEDDSDDDEDETAELQRELEKIKRERAEKREAEEQERAAQEEAERNKDIATGNPLLNTKADFNVKRRWDDDVVFKNQARGTENKRKHEFVNDLLRSDFHKRFMSKYVR